MKLCFVFVVIIAILWMKRPLFWAISGGLAAALVLYGIRVPDALSIMGRSMVSKDTITVVLSFYFITFLQRMLERRNRLKQAEQSLDVYKRQIHLCIHPYIQRYTHQAFYDRGRYSTFCLPDHPGKC